MNNITAFDFKANVSQKVNKSEFVILNEDNEDVADEIDQNALRAAMESELAEMQEKAMRGELNREEKGIMKSIESYLYPVVKKSFWKKLFSA